VRGWIRRLIRSWGMLAVHLGNFHARLLFTMFYFVVVPVFSLLATLHKHPLAFRRLERAGWIPRWPVQVDYASLRRQF